MVTLRTQTNLKSGLRELRLQVGRMLKNAPFMKTGGLYHKIDWDNKNEILEGLDNLDKRLMNLRDALKFEQ